MTQAPEMEKAVEAAAQAIGTVTAAVSAHSGVARTMAERALVAALPHLAPSLSSSDARPALENIAGFRKINLNGEWEHGLRDIIRSMIDCAERALDALPATPAGAGESERLRNELDEARALNLTLSEAAVIHDSYGVEGSSFETCLSCQAGGAPGIPFVHDKKCPVARAEEDAHRWCVEHREEVKELEDEITNLKAILSASPPSAERGWKALSEEEQHAIGHAKYLVERATPENPEVCFDYELVAALLRLLPAAPLVAEPGE